MTDTIKAKTDTIKAKTDTIKVKTDNIKVNTKKNKQKRIDKSHLWNLFDSEINNKNKNGLEQNKSHQDANISKDIECVYNNNTLIERCDICDGRLGITEEGFYNCTNEKCGILYTDVLDLTAEWRYYGADDNSNKDPTRCGMPINPLLEKSSFGCKVICKGASSYEMRKIRRYTEWQSMPYKEKSQYDEFQHITIMAQNEGISKMIIDCALRYHKMISEHKTYRGLNRDGIIAASIYIACRVNGYSRTAKEIAKIFNLDTASATRGCKNAMSIINELDCNKTNSDKIKYIDTKPVSFIERYCSKLNINKELTKLCEFIAHMIEQRKLMPENTPHSVAAGIIYFVVQEFRLNINKKSINNVSEISEVTITKCYKKMDKIKTELIPPVMYKKYLEVNN